MSGYLGLVELLFVLALALGWGAYELWALRRSTRPRQRSESERKPD